MFQLFICLKSVVLIETHALYIFGLGKQNFGTLNDCKFCILSRLVLDNIHVVGLSA